VSGGAGSRVVLGLSAVIVAVTGEQPRILTVGTGPCALPSGTLDPAGTALWSGRCAAGWRSRPASTWATWSSCTPWATGARAVEGERLVTVAYLALVREGPSPTGRGPAGAAGTTSSLGGLPGGAASGAGPGDSPRLGGWAEAAGDGAGREARRERLQIMFGQGGSPRDVERVLERYELLYEAGLVPEAGGPATISPGEAMALDHRRIAAQALGRLRGKLRYRPVVFELLPGTFTLGHLQRVVEALSGVRLHSQNFRRLVARGGWWRPPAESTPPRGPPGGGVSLPPGRPAGAPGPGLGLPGLRTSG